MFGGGDYLGLRDLSSLDIGVSEYNSGRISSKAALTPS